MRRFLKAAAVVLSLTAVAAGSRALRGQAPPSPGAAGASKPADLSGDWAADRTRGGFGQSLSISDMGGRKRGNEDDIPYQPWARTKTLSEKPSTGPDPHFDET